MSYALSLGQLGSNVAPPPAASDAPTDVLLGLFILFVGAKLGEEFARRLGQPAVVGELLGGFVVGPYALGLVTPGETAAVFAELGVIILLFTVGLEVRLDDLLAVGRPAVLTAVIAMILPIAAGLGLGLAIGAAIETAAFVGLALCATSIGITSRVLGEFGVLDRTFARVVLGAAVIDDILALIAIGLVTGAATGEQSQSALFIALSAFGLIGLGFVAARRARGLKREVFTWPLFAETPLVPAFMLMFALALVSAYVGLAAIIGAFVAGLIVAETEAQEELEHDMRPLAQIFTPFFFAYTRCPARSRRAGRPERPRPRRRPCRARRDHQGRRRRHRCVVHRPLGRDHRGVRDGPARRGRHRRRQPRAGDRAPDREPVQRRARCGDRNHHRRALPALDLDPKGDRRGTGWRRRRTRPGGARRPDRLSRAPTSPGRSQPRPFRRSAPGPDRPASVTGAPGPA